jgi:hypothetical protein
MRDDRDTPEQREFPNNWDVLQEPAADDLPAAEAAAPSGPTGPPPILNILAASWADGVAPLGVCTAALVGLNVAGHHGSLSALPWAVALGVAWWAIAAATLVVVRQGTPGMLLAGVVFADRVAPGRVAIVIAAAAASALLLGLPNLLGPRRSLLALAAASVLESAAAD